jgi:hypothetical protein
VWTTEDRAVAAGLSVDLDRWRREFDELMLRVGARFARVEPRRRVAAFVRGLLAGLPRVNCWSIAEHAGEGCPRGMQRLLSAAAGSRWKIEDGFAARKELATLDEHQVRGWTSWHRWTILALVACAFLSVLAAIQPRDGQPHDDQLIPLTRNEIRRLFTSLSEQPHEPAIQLHWSRWRRRHQATARTCHYRRAALALQ